MGSQTQETPSPSHSKVGREAKRLPRSKLARKLKEHNIHERESFHQRVRPHQPVPLHLKTKPKPTGFSLAGTIAEKRVQETKAQEEIKAIARIDVWKNLDILDKKVDYNLSILAGVNIATVEEPMVDQQLWKKFTSNEFQQSIERFLQMELTYDYDGLMKWLPHLNY